jgi:hypothetical protein
MKYISGIFLCVTFFLPKLKSVVMISLPSSHIQLNSSRITSATLPIHAPLLPLLASISSPSPLRLSFIRGS